VPSLSFKVSLDRSDYERCLEFILKLWYLWGGITTDFRGSGVKRDIGKYIHDQIGGKLAEVTVQKIMKNYGIEAKLGFEKYASREDMKQGDIEEIKEASGGWRPPKLKVEVKDTKPSSEWWLIPRNEWNDRVMDVYVLVNLDLPLDDLIKYFRKSLKITDPELESTITELTELPAEIVAIYFRNDLAPLLSEFNAGDYLLKTEIFQPARSVPTFTATKKVRKFEIEGIAQGFTASDEVELSLKQNPKTVTSYINAPVEVTIAHPVLGHYRLGKGLYRCRPTLQSPLREANMGVPKRRLVMDGTVWQKFLREV